MLRLRPYDPSDANHVVGWIKDELSFRKWCADRLSHYPITADELNAHYADTDENFFVMTAFDDSGAVGQLIMRFLDEEKTHLRFGFIIVDDSRRGCGYGKGMLRLALEYAFRILKVNTVSLGVFENNPPAHHCYKAAGFRETGGSWECNIMGEVWKCIELAVNAEEYYDSI